jgi:SAM-dependent methyltransferase
MFAIKVMTSMYEKARSHEELPWYRPELPRLLLDAMRTLPRGARVLDVGCGAGTLAVQIAKSGCDLDVTGIDIIPRALELARAHAHAENVSVRFVEADLLSWEPSARFDLVLDSGCLHSLIGRADAYKERLLSWLAPGGDFVLGHWGKRHALDWRPIGPRRRTRQELVEIFAPDFAPHAHVDQLMTGIPLPFGPSVLGVGIWFKHQLSKDYWQ